MEIETECFVAKRHSLILAGFLNIVFRPHDAVVGRIMADTQRHQLAQIASGGGLRG